MKLTTETKQKIKDYLLNAISSEDYGIKTETEQEKLKFLWDTFKSEYGFKIEQVGTLKALSDWIQGLPTAYNIDFYNCDILKKVEEWGQDTSTESKQDKLISQWFDFISNQTLKLMKQNKVGVV